MSAIKSSTDAFPILVTQREGREGERPMPVNVPSAAVMR
jgi:hypothetical protein